MKTIADVLREEGKEQGKQQGIAESLLMMLGDKVGPIPEDIQKQIYLVNYLPLKRSRVLKWGLVKALIV